MLISKIGVDVQWGHTFLKENRGKSQIKREILSMTVELLDKGHSKLLKSEGK